MGITASDLIKYFEDRLHLMDMHQSVDLHGIQPEFPMIVVFLGSDAVKSYQDIASRLFRLWPSYKDALRFLAVTGTVADIEYFRLSPGNGECARQHRLQEEDVSALQAEISDIRNGFNSYAKKLVYFVMSTSGMSDLSDYEEWMEIYLKVKETLGFDLSEFFILLLDEKERTQQKLAKKIRNCIADKNHIVPRMLLLSNFDSGERITSDWSTCYAVASSVIALTNNPDNVIYNILFQKEIRTVTASYVCEKKPMKDIGWVVVTKMIDYLFHMKMCNTADDPFEDSNIGERLGLDKTYGFRIMEPFIEENLFQRLPKENQLKLFPRRNGIRGENIASCSEKEFNEMTMNAWICYLEQMIKEAEKKLETGSEAVKQWKQDYESYIKSTFSVEEMMRLANQPEKIRSVFKDYLYFTDGEDQVLASAKWMLKRRLFSDDKILDAFAGVIKECGIRARASFDIWEQLADSASQVHAVKDETIINFYRQKVTNYFDSNGKELSKKLKEIIDTEKLDGFLKKIIDEIINSDPVFCVPFDQERSNRLQAGNDILANANRDILAVLTDRSKMFIQLNVNFAFQAPIASAVMLKFGTPLDIRMKQKKDELYYYDTGNNESAEVIVFYKVEKYHLMNSDGCRQLGRNK